MTDFYDKEKTIYSAHYALGYYRNGNIYFSHTEDTTIGCIIDSEIRTVFYRYLNIRKKMFSKYKLPCEKLYEAWVDNKEDIIKHLKCLAQEQAESHRKRLATSIPQEDQAEVKELFDAFFERLAVDFYDATEQYYDFQIWQKGVEKEAIETAKTKEEKEYHQFLYSSLY